MARGPRKPRPPSAARREAEAPVWLTGLHAVREALRARRRRLVRLRLRAERRRPEQGELIELAGAAGIPVESVDARRFAAGLDAEGHDQGVALLAGPIPEQSLAELIREGREAAGPRWIVALDGVEDPQNVGALVRVAESAGVHGLVLTERRAPRLTPAVSRASAGAIEWLAVARVANLARALQTLKEADHWVVACAPGADRTLFELEDRHLEGNLVVVLGAEGRGIRRTILEQADHRVAIPMRGRIDSLNVSTAGAILLYDLVRRRLADGGAGG
jgi:23S rRNA (guanosine2251-2'-O)-methyltransferase